VLVHATDLAGNQSDGSFTVTVRDIVAPVLSLPANLTIGAASASGSVATFTATATDPIDPAPVVIAVPPSGSTFPIGITTVHVTATDSAGNISTGTFTVTVRDLVAPTLTLTSPKPGQKVIAGKMLFSGHATDDRAVARVEVSLNGAVAQTVTPSTVTSDFLWTLSTVPETGVNTVVVTAYDLFNNPSPAISRTFTFVQLRPAFAGNYNGLLTATAESLSPIEHEGLISLAVLPTGSFTGKLTLSGTIFSLKGVFSKDGSARFGVTSTLELRKGPAAAALLLGQLKLNLDMTPGSERITGSITQGAAIVALLEHADRALYTAKKDPVPPLMNVPAELMDPQNGKGQYTVQFLAGDSPNNGVTAFPHTDGLGSAKIASNGTVRLTGKLADGSSISYGNALSKENELPVFVLLYKKRGLFSGTLLFELNQTGAASTAFKWFRRPSVSDKIYPAGWPEGIVLEVEASRFVKPSDR
jgi:hypothetical protein